MEETPKTNRRPRRHKLYEARDKDKQTRGIQEPTLTRAVQTTMLVNELDRLKLLQGHEHTLSKYWVRDHEDVTDLHYASFYGDLKSVKRLLAGAETTNADIRTHDGPKLLQQERKITTDMFDNDHHFGFFLNTTPLMMACQQGHLDVVKYLIGHARADVNSRDSLGLTSLAFAASAGHTEVAKYLLSKCAHKNIQETHSGRSPLVLATVNNQIEMAKVLVKRDVNVHVKDKHGRMAIHYAAWNYNFDLVSLLASQSSVETAINSQDFDGNTPLHLLVSDFEIEPATIGDFTSERETRVVGDIIQRISKYGNVYVDICRKHNRGSGQCGEEYTCLVNMIKMGANVNIQNNTGMTVMHVLCARLTPIIYSQGYLYIDNPLLSQTNLVMLNILLKCGVSKDGQDLEGNTPLSLSLEQKNWLAVKMLSRCTEVEPRSELTIDAFKSLSETVAAFGWGHMIKHVPFERDLEQMSTSLLTRHKKCKKDQLVDRIFSQ